VTPRYAAVVGLGFGDCGKGLFTDALCRRWPVHTVARFNGGAQAGHNVVLPDGRHHTFSQFGAGTFVPGVHTLLASPVVVHPTALLVEDEFLRRAGIADALTRLTIAAACRVTTPYHQAAGRLRERLRGAHAHGSCGVGVGETVAHAIAHPGEALRYADLAQPRRAREKLAAIRHALAAQFDCSALDGEEVRALRDDDLATRWLAQAQQLARQVAPADEAVVAARLQREGTLLFEGAQGVLLDESRGFHPHTTWSDVRPAAAEGVLAAAGVHAPVLRLGIVRAYATRHGAGPLPTHDAALDAHAEPHNGDAGWQGRFRRGHPDALLLRYAVEAAGPLDGLLALGRELLAPTLIAPETLQEAATVAFPGLSGILPDFGRYEPLDWGLGFELRDAKEPHWTGIRNSPRTFGHFGGAGSFLWVDPEVGVACTSLADRQFGPWAKDAWPPLSDAVLAELR